MHICSICNKKQVIIFEFLYTSSSFSLILIFVIDLNEIPNEANYQKRMTMDYFYNIT